MLTCQTILPWGFTGSTPFNGEHTAGPLAFVTRPDVRTALGPLCLDPITGRAGGRASAEWGDVVRRLYVTHTT